MLQVATQLDQALRAAGLPLVGVSLGRLADKTTWRVDLEPTATDLQQRQASQLVAAFVPLPPAEDPRPLTAEEVLAWCATKLGVDVMDATLEVVAGMTVEKQP